MLFLSAWYPNRTDPMLGLFVERHARALATKCNVAVLYVQPVKKSSRKFETVIRKEPNFTEVILYYRNVSIPLIGTLLKALRYRKSFKKAMDIVYKEYGDFDLIHSNILTRTGVMAYFQKKAMSTPYIITEHWSRYLPATGTYKGALRKILTKKVVKNASAITAVTENLKNAMIGHGLAHENFHIVPNVVDTDLFQPPGNKPHRKKKEFIHISCFEDRSKNISGILRVIKHLSLLREDFICRMVGDGMDFQQLKNYSGKLGIPDENISFEGLKTGHDLAESLRNADFLIMFSNYENMPVVINEAFSCGLPVISSDVGGIAETVNPENGILVKARDEIALLEALQYMLDHHSEYNSYDIRKKAVENFSIPAVSEKFLKIYEGVLKK